MQYANENSIGIAKGKRLTKIDMEALRCSPAGGFVFAEGAMVAY